MGANASSTVTSTSRGGVSCRWRHTWNHSAANTHVHRYARAACAHRHELQLLLCVTELARQPVGVTPLLAPRGGAVRAGTTHLQGHDSASTFFGGIRFALYLSRREGQAVEIVDILVRCTDPRKAGPVRQDPRRNRPCLSPCCNPTPACQVKRPSLSEGLTPPPPWGIRCEAACGLPCPIPDAAPPPPPPPDPLERPQLPPVVQDDLVVLPQQGVTLATSKHGLVAGGLRHRATQKAERKAQITLQWCTYQARKLRYRAAATRKHGLVAGPVGGAGERRGRGSSVYAKEHKRMVRSRPARTACLQAACRITWAANNERYARAIPL